MTIDDLERLADTPLMDYPDNGFAACLRDLVRCVRVGADYRFVDARGDELRTIPRKEAKEILQQAYGGLGERVH